MRYRLDPGSRLIDDDRIVIGGSPLTIMRLTEAGGHFVRRLISSPSASPSPSPSASPSPSQQQDAAVLFDGSSDGLTRADMSPSAAPDVTTKFASTGSSRLGPPDAGPAASVAPEVGRAYSAGQGRLLDRLLDAGIVHPDVASARFDDPETVLSISVVIPVHDGDPGRLAQLVSRLTAVRTGVDIELDIVVVDDASSLPLRPLAGARSIRLDRNLGPGGARNRGVAESTGDLLVFLDADTAFVATTKPAGRSEVADGDSPLDESAPAPDSSVTSGAANADRLFGMLGHFIDPKIGLVAARVRSHPGTSLRERYEEWRSPLDLGTGAARVRQGSRISYVPAAAMAVRRTALAEVGGFDETLRYGEDVDLVWRLDGAGWRCRYEPAAEVFHDSRPSWSAWWRQRAMYGSSAAPLAARHPGALAPVRVSGWTAASWALTAVGQPVVGVGIAAATTAALTRKLPVRHRGAEALRLAGLGHLFGGRILASAMWRAWWPITVTLAVVSRRARRAAVVAAVLPSLIDWSKQRPSIDPARAVALRLADDLAYGSGLWLGMWRARSLQAIKPDFTNWPGRQGLAS